MEETKVDEDNNAELVLTSDDHSKPYEEHSPSTHDKIDTQKSDYLVANMIQDRSDMSGESPNPDTNTDTLQRGELTNMTLGQNITDRNANFSPDDVESGTSSAKIHENNFK